MTQTTCSPTAHEMQSCTGTHIHSDLYVCACVCLSKSEAVVNLVTHAKMTLMTPISQEQREQTRHTHSSNQQNAEREV